MSEERRRDEAIGWHVRLASDEAGATDWEAFADWLAQDERNRLAYDAVEDMSSMIDDNCVELSTALARTAVVPLPARRRFVMWGSGLALAASILLAVAVLLSGRPEPAWTTYRTATGEKATFTLADGSVIHLNTRTTLQVSLSDDERDVRLGEGQATFEVAKNPSRPFIVSAADHRVRVVGTVFDVLLHDGRLAVTVSQGIVQVRKASAEERAVTRLGAGQQLIYDRATKLDKVRQVNPATTTSWRQGRLTYDDAPLAEVLEDLSRYFPVPLVSGDRNVAALRFSGVLKVDSEDAVIARLEGFLPLAASREADRIVLRSRQ